MQRKRIAPTNFSSGDRLTHLSHGVPSATIIFTTPTNIDFAPQNHVNIAKLSGGWRLWRIRACVIVKLARSEAMRAFHLLSNKNSTDCYTLERRAHKPLWRQIDDRNFLFLYKAKKEERTSSSEKQKISNESIKYGRQIVNIGVRFFKELSKQITYIRRVKRFELSVIHKGRLMLYFAFWVNEFVRSFGKLAASVRGKFSYYFYNWSRLSFKNYENYKQLSINHLNFF